MKKMSLLILSNPKVRRSNWRKKERSSINIPFRVIGSTSFKAFVKALNPTYGDQLPSVNKVASYHLETYYAKLESKLKNSHHLTLITDSYKNINSDNIQWFCVKIPCYKTPFFVGSINTKGVSQTAKQVATNMVRFMENFGVKIFTSIMSDNCPAIIAAKKIVSSDHTNIIEQSCSVHEVKLIINDIMKYPKNQIVLNEIDKIVCSAG